MTARAGKSAYPILRVFAANRLYGVYIGPTRQTTAEGRKSERIMSGLIAYYETMSVIHCGNLSRLEYQLEYLGKADSDYLADRLEVLFFILEQPEDIGLEYFETMRKTVSTPIGLTKEYVFDQCSS